MGKRLSDEEKQKRRKEAIERDIKYLLYDAEKEEDTKLSKERIGIFKKFGLILRVAKMKDMREMGDRGRYFKSIYVLEPGGKRTLQFNGDKFTLTMGEEIGGLKRYMSKSEVIRITKVLKLAKHKKPTIVTPTKKPVITKKQLEDLEKREKEAEKERERKYKSKEKERERINKILNEKYKKIRKETKKQLSNLSKYVKIIESKGYKIKTHDYKNVMGTHFTLVNPGGGESDISTIGIKAMARNIAYDLEQKKKVKVTKPKPVKKVSKPVRKKKVSKPKVKPKKVIKKKVDGTHEKILTDAQIKYVRKHGYVNITICGVKKKVKKRNYAPRKRTIYWYKSGGKISLKTVRR